MKTELLHRLLLVDVSGNLFWKARTPDLFKRGKYSAQRACDSWNAKHAERKAFTYRDSEGYNSGTILRGKFRAHRVIWAMLNGHWPENEIDHIDGNRTNNIPSNLRIATHLMNGRNQKRHRDNRSGHTGVSFLPRYGAWQARIGVNGKKIHLGFFKDKSLAIAVRAEAELVHGFHANHGRDAARADTKGTSA